MVWVVKQLTIAVTLLTTNLCLVVIMDVIMTNHDHTPINLNIFSPYPKPKAGAGWERKSGLWFYLKFLIISKKYNL